MFTKISRYKNLKDTVLTGTDGHSRSCKSIRLLPETTGTFLHTVAEADRLDHLAYKYYRQSRTWWHICDANPSFLSPLDLLTEGPLETWLIPVFFAKEHVPPWYLLLKNLCQLTGVINVSVTPAADDAQMTADFNDGGVAPETGVFTGTVSVVINRLNLSYADVSQTLSDNGFTPGAPLKNDRAGKQIMIPNNPEI